VDDRNGWGKRAAAAYLGAAWLVGAVAADEMTTTDDLLKSPKFKTAYLAALGPKAKEKWLATMTNSGLVRTETVAGERWQVATPCKPHDCADNNLFLLYSPSRGALVGHLYEKGRVTTLGSPDAALGAELQRLWNKEFRQR
jgi:inhibitor of lysozyme (Ivy)